jgi:hypothetical protein
MEVTGMEVTGMEVAMVQMEMVTPMVLVMLFMMVMVTIANTDGGVSGVEHSSKPFICINS